MLKARKGQLGGETRPLEEVRPVGVHQSVEGETVAPAAAEVTHVYTRVALWGRGRGVQCGVQCGEQCGE